MDILTLDTNTLISIEKKEPGYEDILKLKKLNDSGVIKLRIPAIIASDKQINKQTITNFEEFVGFLNEIDFGNLELIEPPFYWGITFWGHSLWGGDNELEKKIHDILRPKIEFDYQEYCTKNNINPNAPTDPKWRNKKCDVLILWSHIYYSGDIFVSNDGHFFGEKREALINLGAKNILRPIEVCNLYNV